MITDTDDGYVKTQSQDGIATIEFFHPQGNSLPSRILRELAHAIHEEGKNDETNVIVLQSAGDRTFCSGASFKELAAITNEEEGLAFFSGFANVINAMRKAPKFIIARVQGKCVGGGVGIVAAADYAIAAEGADIKLSELSLGIGPFVVGPAVERKVGLPSFTELTIDSTTWRSAEWAWRKGLFAELHSDSASMDNAIARLAKTLAGNNPEAMKELKKIFWKGTEDWDELLIERAAISGRLILSGHSKKFIDNYNKKRD